MYKRHAFFCCNEREAGESCCAQHGAERLMRYARDLLARDYPEKAQEVRINKAGCLGRCDLGPVIVIYPEGIWYTYIDEEDVAAIVREHLVAGRVVERLRLAD